MHLIPEPRAQQASTSISTTDAALPLSTERARVASQLALVKSYREVYCEIDRIITAAESACSFNFSLGSFKSYQNLINNWEAVSFKLEILCHNLQTQPKIFNLTSPVNPFFLKVCREHLDFIEKIIIDWRDALEHKGKIPDREVLYFEQIVTDFARSLKHCVVPNS